MTRLSFLGLVLGLNVSLAQVQPAGFLHSTNGGLLNDREQPRFKVLALAEATRRSAAEMSGRRSNSSEGKPGGTKGGAIDSLRSMIRKVEAGCPTRIASACSNCARWSATAGNWA